jgi:hypothetical protein
VQVYDERFNLKAEWYEVVEGLGSPQYSVNAPGHTEFKALGRGVANKGDVVVLESLGGGRNPGVSAKQPCPHCQALMSSKAKEEGVFIIYNFANRIKNPDIRLYTPSEGFVKKN